MLSDSNAPESVKESVAAVISALPDTVSWDDVQYHLYVREQIEAGLADSEAGRLLSTEEVRRRLEARRNPKTA